ncbi:PREDICTED: zinc finger BED domain-containing protein 3-like [Chrysochloris asiatica]|uniref:Zinc finger BED domain-containing protein 3-like n=1 Tax=Chrysochloris asiatica TaxID=185453 RepID=A0A9B0WYH7_CHRAS|nr:PREDICTED: zinc finger BED domain-containing protein 3-like [Chrysochloris asiatica]
MSEELAVSMEETCDPEDAAAPGLAPPGRLGALYSEAWGYFHLAPARPGHASGYWATCRLCGDQVRCSPSFHAGTQALWKHLKSVHRWELEKSGARHEPPAAPCAPPPAAAAEGDWARLLEQMGALAFRASRRERELERREAAVEQGERALERRRRALQEEERAVAQARQQLLAEREALLREVSRRGCSLGVVPVPLQIPLKEELDREMDDYIITKVL